MTTIGRRPRGRCRYCGRTLALTKDGRVRLHTFRDGGQRRTCGGSGQVPS